MLTYLEGARTLTAFVGKKPRTALKNHKTFKDVKATHREHQPRCLDFMEEGDPETFVTPMSKSLSESVEGQS